MPSHRKGLQALQLAVLGFTVLVKNQETLRMLALKLNISFNTWNFGKMVFLGHNI